MKHAILPAPIEKLNTLRKELCGSNKIKVWCIYQKLFI